MRARSKRAARSLAVIFASLAVTAIACSSFEEGKDDVSSSSGGPDGGGGEAGSGDTGGEASPPCIDTSSDGRNCGSCGHDCLGGQCVGGVCLPVEIGRTTDAPVKSIAVSASRVFWMTSAAANGGFGSVYSCAKTGCVDGVPETMIGPENTMGTLASDGSTVWASVAYGAERVQMFSPNGTIDVDALDGFDAIFYMEAQSSRLYVVNHAGPNNGRQIVSWKPGETSPTPVATFVGPASPVNTLQASFTADRMYLGAINTNLIVTCPLVGCTTWTDFASTLSGIQSMTNDDENVYWIEVDTWSVRACAAGASCTGAKDILTVGQLGGNAFTAAYSHASKKLNILTKANEVLECDPASCAATKRVLAKETLLDSTYAIFGSSLAADDRAVYYAAIDGAGASPVYRIMRVAR